MDAFTFDVRRNPEAALIDVAPVMDGNVCPNRVQHARVGTAPTGGGHTAGVEDQAIACMLVLAGLVERGQVLDAQYPGWRARIADDVPVGDAHERLCDRAVL